MLFRLFRPSRSYWETATVRQTIGQLHMQSARERPRSCPRADYACEEASRARLYRETSYEHHGILA